MTRHIDWPARLAPAIHAWRDRGHDYGTTDCVCFALSVLSAIGAANPLPGGVNWTTPRGALRVMRRVGGISGALAATFAEIPADRALSGDLIVSSADPETGFEGVWVVCAGRAWAMTEGWRETLAEGVVVRVAPGLISVDLAALVAGTAGLRAFTTADGGAD